jgi:hypothetical protein
MRQALGGLAASAALYVLGNVLWVHLTRRAWSSLPPTDVEEMAARDEARTWTVRSLLHVPTARTLVWLLSAALVAALLWIAEFSLPQLVLFFVLLGAAWSWNTVGALRSDAQRRQEERGPEPPWSARAPKWLPVGYYTFGFMISAGTLGTACFAGAIVANTLT